MSSTTFDHRSGAPCSSRSPDTSGLVLVYSSINSDSFHFVSTPGPTAAISAAVNASSFFRTSGVPTSRAKGRTTFSSFGYDTYRQLSIAEYGAALANIAANVTLGLAAVWIGVIICGRTMAYQF